MRIEAETLARPGAKPPGFRVDLLGDAEGRLARALFWLRQNLFSSIPNTLLTLVVIAILALALPPLYDWLVADATLAGDSKAACTGDGACWTFIKVRLPTFFYGHFPPGERWRVNLALLLLVLFGLPVMRERMW